MRFLLAALLALSGAASAQTLPQPGVWEVREHVGESPLDSSTQQVLLVAGVPYFSSCGARDEEFPPGSYFQPALIRARLVLADETTATFSGTICFFYGATAASLRVVAGLALDDMWPEPYPFDAWGAEAWSGSAAPGEVIPWTFEIYGPSEEGRLMLVMASSRGGPSPSVGADPSTVTDRPLQSGGDAMYYAFRSGHAISATTPRGLDKAEYEFLLAEAGLENATPEQIREAAPILYLMLMNGYSAPEIDEIRKSD